MSRATRTGQRRGKFGLGLLIRPQSGNTRAIMDGYLGRDRRRLPLVALMSTITATAQATSLVLIASSALALAQDRRVVRVSAGAAHADLDLHVAAAISASCAIVMIVLQVAAGKVTASLVKKAESECRRRVVHAYVGASWEHVARRERGELQQILTHNVTRVVRGVMFRSARIFGLANLVILVGAAFFIAPALAALLIAVMALFALPLRPIKARTRKAAARHATVEREFATFVAGVVEQTRETHVFDVGDAIDERSLSLSVPAAEQQRRVQFLLWTAPSVYSGVALLSLTIAIALVAAFGNGHIDSIGPMVLLLLRSLVYGQMVLTSTQNLVEGAPYLQELEDHVSMYQAGARSDGTVDTGPLQRLVFTNASYRYPDSATIALSEVSISIERGTTIGVVGPTGGGKTTFAELVLRLRHVTTGSYAVNGVDAKDLHAMPWSRRVAYVPQHSVVFDGTIRANIRFYRPWISDEDIERAARDAQIDIEIRAMPMGYDTVVSGIAVGLSGGQRQRICIARALAGKPELLVLDEPTSGLDVQSERLFIETITRLKNDKTLLVIAHRLETISVCDRVIVVEGGRLVGEGPSHLLLSEDGFFSTAMKIARTETDYVAPRPSSGNGGP